MIKWQVETLWFCGCSEHGNEPVDSLEMVHDSLGVAAQEWINAGESRVSSVEYSTDGRSLWIHSGRLYDLAQIREHCARKDADVHYAAYLSPTGDKSTWTPMRGTISWWSYRRVARWLGKKFFKDAKYFWR